jgi:hypothetical protein
VRTWSTKRSARRESRGQEIVAAPASSAEAVLPLQRQSSDCYKILRDTNHECALGSVFAARRCDALQPRFWQRYENCEHVCIRVLRGVAPSIAAHLGLGRGEGFGRSFARALRLLSARVGRMRALVLECHCAPHCSGGRHSDRVIVLASCRSTQFLLPALSSHSPLPRSARLLLDERSWLFGGRRESAEVFPRIGRLGHWRDRAVGMWRACF